MNRRGFLRASWAASAAGLLLPADHLMFLARNPVSIVVPERPDEFALLGYTLEWIDARTAFLKGPVGLGRLDTVSYLVLPDEPIANPRSFVVAPAELSDGLRQLFVPRRRFLANRRSV